MSLLKLPQEIITQIFDHLADDDQACSFSDDVELRLLLCALARMCRRFWRPATDQLYARVVFVLAGPDSLPVSRRMRLLSARLRADPAVEARIRSCYITWDGPSQRTRRDKKAYDEFVDQLSRSESLVRLGLRISAVTTPRFLRFLGPGGFQFPALKELELEIGDTRNHPFQPADLIIDLFELPRLETMALQAPVAGFSWRILDDEVLGVPLPHLKELSTGWSRPVSTDLLAAVLPRAPNLENLQLLVPGRAELAAREYNSDTSTMGYDLLEPLQPARLGGLLAPVAESLKYLQLEATNVTFPGHDHTRIDLSAFRSLRHLTISSYLLFGDGPVASGYEESQPLWRSLPPRLEDLEISFDGRQGVFWSMTEMREEPSIFEHAHWERRHRDSYVEWLAELLAAVAIGKGTQGTADSSRDGNATITLGSVSIMEGDFVDSDRNWEIARWSAMTGRLKDLAKTAGAELVIHLRVPRDFKSNECEVVCEAWQDVDDDLLTQDGIELEESEDD